MATAVEIAAAVRSRTRSAPEVAEEALRAAEEWQPRTNAFSQIRPEATLAEAGEVQGRLDRGEDPGPLAGVPVAVKDLFDVAGWETTGCCRAFAGRVATRDAEAVRRLRAAGAVVVGKTNQHELAAGATNLISASGPTRNPRDPGRITGGSSGGSAAAVAAGVVPLALGSDTGGSVRIPASFCGVVGLKPTTGVVPLDGAMPLAPSLDTAGPLTGDAGDCALVLSVLAGREADPGAEVERCRVLVLEGDYGRTADEAALEAVEVTAGALTAAGAIVDRGELRGVEDAPEVWELVAWPEFVAAYPELEASDVHPRTEEILRFGRRHLDGLPDARRRMDAVRAAFDRGLADAEVLLLPTTPFPAPRLEERIVQAAGIGLDLRRGAPSILTRPVNLSGLPAVSVPVEAGTLPIGVQLVGRRDEEALLLALAGVIEAANERR